MGANKEATCVGVVIFVAALKFLRR